MRRIDSVSVMIEVATNKGDAEACLYLRSDETVSEFAARVRSAVVDVCGGEPDEDEDECEGSAAVSLSDDDDLPF